MASVELSPADDVASGSQVRDGDQSPDDGKDNTAPKSKNPRKRTKTGCLTCRRRRIKCDEAKPTCNNCTKSRRHCEGYNQRVVFKDPISAFHGPFGSVVYPPDPSEFLVNTHLQGQARSSNSQGPLPIIAPRPPRIEFPSPSAFFATPQQSAQRHNVAGSGLGLPPSGFEHHHGMPIDHPSFFEPPPMSPGGGVTFQHVPGLDPTFISQELGSQYTGQLSSPDIERPGPIQTSQAAFASPPVGAVPYFRTTSHHEPSPSVPYHAQPHYDELHQGHGDEREWIAEDDTSMADSEDSADCDQRTHHHTQLSKAGMDVRARLDATIDAQGLNVRSFSSFANDNILATYHPNGAQSPLNDPRCAAIFYYFITVTGPSMSLYERHPQDTPGRVREHIWSHTFPNIAMHHPALLHAMLALGSLQMAKLQETSALASLKHYELCIRRLSKNYSSPSRRLQPATLAATLILGFYEVWNSDHDKWCRHMWGARTILKEVPLRKMTQARLESRRRRRQSEMERNHKRSFAFPPYAGEVADKSTGELDMGLISQLHGTLVDYDSPDLGVDSPHDYHTEKDLATCENVSDLFWWYCKMDVYQSILAASPLLMEYELWSQCAPRAPMGRMDAIYGTFDHLMIVLGRLANFAYKDMARKRKVRHAPSQGKSPPFAGMMPSTGRFEVHQSFSPPKKASTWSEDFEHDNLESSTREALVEWYGILQALELFKSRLGPDFDPMADDEAAAPSSPFGKARVYRTYSIAGIWMNYHMGLIALQRAHPDMPPTAMAAVGQRAYETFESAMEIGRIAAGLVDDLSQVTAVSTLLGSVCIESCFPLFVAAVQFQDNEQRLWTVKRLHDVARLTGWQSARQIARGCEVGWIKAAEARRGPPYQPAQIEVSRVVWTQSRRLEERIKDLTEEQAKLNITNSEKASYALGLLGVEEDIAKLSMDGQP